MDGSALRGGGALCAEALDGVGKSPLGRPP